MPDDLQLLAQGVYVSLIMRDKAEAGRRFGSLEKLYPGTRDALGSGCLYYYGTGQAANALPYCARLTEQFPTDHTSHSNYGWAALDANQFQLAFQELSQAYKLSSTDGNQLNLTETQAVDLEWGITIAYYESGDKAQAYKTLQFIRQEYPASATVTGLQRLPLLWSATTMDRIETILREFPSKDAAQAEKSTTLAEEDRRSKAEKLSACGNPNTPGYADCRGHVNGYIH